MPARMIGRVAPAMRSAARSIASSVGSGKASVASSSGWSEASTSVAAMSSGSSMWVGPGFSMPRHPERLGDDLGDRARDLDPCRPLRDRLEHPRDVDVLVRLLVDLVDPGLPGERDHRRAVEVGVGDAGDEVRRARPQRRHRDRAAAGEPAVDVGHERGALLVAGRDVADARVVGERLEDVHRLLAGHGEDVLAALGREAVDEEVGGRPPVPGVTRAVYGLSVARTVRRRPAARPTTRARTRRARWRARRRIDSRCSSSTVSSSQALASRTIPKAIRNITPW